MSPSASNSFDDIDITPEMRQRLAYELMANGFTKPEAHWIVTEYFPIGMYFVDTARDLRTLYKHLKLFFNNERN